ncbi:MAG: hypothetical protein P8X63_04680 [Desulfuromonadaceae bacterium]
MASILLLAHKKYFDFTLGSFLKNFHRVFFMTSDPMTGLFFACQAEPIHELFAIKPASDHPPLPASRLRALKNTEAYATADSPELKKAVERLCVAYFDHLTKFIDQNQIDLIITQDMPYLDVACATEVAIERNIPVCYLGTGLFRRETMTVGFERLLPTDVQTWARRLANEAGRRTIEPVTIPATGENRISPRKPSGLMTFLYSLRYLRNPRWTQTPPDQAPARTLLEEQKHKLRKKHSRKIPPEPQPALEKPFVLLTLQGNEICRQVENPLGIRDMEHLCALIIPAIREINAGASQPLALIVKEHPNRAGVISAGFKERYPDVHFVTKTSIEPLLEQARLVITFNSLSGFEALQRYKPVVTLGPVFFAQPEICFPVATLEDLAATIKQALAATVSRAAIGHLVAFLKRHFELECPGFSRKNPSAAGLEMIASKIEGGLRMAKHEPLHPESWTA